MSLGSQWDVPLMRQQQGKKLSFSMQLKLYYVSWILRSPLNAPLSIKSVSGPLRNYQLLLYSSPLKIALPRGINFAIGNGITLSSTELRYFYKCDRQRGLIGGLHMTTEFSAS